RLAATNAEPLLDSAAPAAAIIQLEVVVLLFRRVEEVDVAARVHTERAECLPLDRCAEEIVATASLAAAREIRWQYEVADPHAVDQIVLVLYRVTHLEPMENLTLGTFRMR